jgi:sodium/proline symporter
MTITVITLITFAIYCVVILAIAGAAYYHTKNHADYILGSRQFNPLITAMGVAASDMSAWLMLSVPGIVYAFGLNQIWLPVSLIIGSYLNWYFVAPRLRVYTEVAKDSLTIPSYLKNRFGEGANILRYVAAIIFLVFFTYYAASGFVAGAKVFVTAFEMTYFQGLLLTAPIIILYSVVGGYIAVNWIDLLQGSLMLFALLLIPLFAMMDTGGLQDIWHEIQVDFPHKAEVWYSLTALGLISSLTWGLGYFGQPHILVRFMSARNERTIHIGRRICISWMAFALAGAVLVGFFGIAYFPEGSLPSSEAVLPELAKRILNPWFTGLVYAAIISAIMSTSAAVLIVAGSALIHDLYHRALRPQASQKELVWLGRLVVLAVSLVAFYMALKPNDPSVFKLVSHAWGGLGASFGPLIIVSLYSRNMTKLSALLGMVFGGGTVLLWLFLRQQFDGIFELYELFPAFIASFIGIAIGFAISKPKISEQQVFDAMLAKLK